MQLWSLCIYVVTLVYCILGDSLLKFSRKKKEGKTSDETFGGTKVTEYTPLSIDKYQGHDVLYTKFGTDKQMLKVALTKREDGMYFLWYTYWNTTKCARSKAFSKHCSKYDDPDKYSHYNPIHFQASPV